MSEYAWQRYLDGRRTEITEETASTYYYRLKLFVEWCKENEIETVAELDGWLLDQYKSARAAKGVAATTLHNEMETIEKFVAYLERIEAVDDGLADRVPIPVVPDDQKSRETKLDPDRALELIRYYRSSDQAGSCNYALLEVALHTGARLGGLRALDLRDFDASEQPSSSCTDRWLLGLWVATTVTLYFSFGSAVKGIFLSSISTSSHPSSSWRQWFPSLESRR